MTAWTITHEDDVAVLALDLKGEPVNKLTPEVVAEFERLFFGELAEDPLVRAVVLTSDKQDNFLAGADIDQFLLIKTAEEGTAMDKRGQDLINRVEASPSPQWSRFTAPAWAPGSRWRSPAGGGLRPIIPRPSSACPKCRLELFRAQADVSGCRERSVCALRWT